MWLWMLFGYCTLNWLCVFGLMWHQLDDWLEEDGELAELLANRQFAAAAALVTILTAPFWFPFALLGLLCPDHD